MKTTSHYGLKKPDGTDVVNIQDLNDNADAIDAALAGKAANTAATATAAGLMSPADKKKLDEISAGGNGDEYYRTGAPLEYHG